MTQTYAKLLSKTDVGENGTHQGGICVPKSLTPFFPNLNTKRFNPDVWLELVDTEGYRWPMRYLYYNGRTFNPPKNTRNEYRITHMSKFFKSWNITAGDSILFTSTEHKLVYKVSISSKENPLEIQTPRKEIIKLSGWNRIC